MIKEKINMELRARIVLIFSISSLILYLSVEGLNILPSISIAQPNSKLDKVNQLFKDEGLTVLANEAAGTVPGPDEAKAALGPVSPTPLDKAKQVIGSILSMGEALHKAQDLAPGSSSFLTEAQKSSSPADPASLWDEIGVSSDLGEAPVTSSILHGAEAVLSPAPSSILDQGAETSMPVPDPNLPSFSPAPAPTLTPSGFFDHDIALAIEARIKQSQTDSQLAMDEAKKLLKDPDIASSETGKCLRKCVDKYAASLDELNRAVTDLGVRDVRLLVDDFGAVETDISTCQACFTQNIGHDSPLKGLEEATTKAARECLTVMDYAS